ncbi:MAG: nucleotidyltransferase family protein, partial [Bacteroidales bacterium]|nr:nucleotidyltransferase family protein [Bacteroidales bacterium]
MKAMVFAAGLGTRLRPYTNDRPKALVEVGGVTMLERVITHLASCGVDDITVNIHHFGDKIIDFLESKNNFGLNIHISDERDLLLDTGGGLIKARKFLDGDEPFIVHNADVLTDLDLRAMYDFHVSHDALSTILVKSRETQRYFLFDHEQRLSGWINKATGETKPAGVVYDPEKLNTLAFGCVHILSPAIFDVLEEYSQGKGKVFSIAPFYAEECHRHKIYGYQHPTPYNWLDIGKPETLAQAEE